MLKEAHKAFIEEIPFYKHLNNDEKKLFDASIVYHRYPKKTIMHSGADDCSGLFLVKSGQLRAFIVSEASRELTVYRLFEYDICLFSATCILKNIEFDILIETNAETEVFIIPSMVYNRLMNENIQVLKFTNALMSSRFSDVMWIVEQTIFMSFDKRLAIFLQEHINIEGSHELKITHEEIAKHLASAREVVTRMLKYFQSENILKIHRGMIEITNIKKLRTLSE